MQSKSDRNSFVAREHCRAFTLVEMLLVLMILGLLAAIVYPNIFKRRGDSQAGACKVQIKAIESALQIYEVDNGYFPKGPHGLLDLVQPPHDAKNWRGPYLDKLPQDPWGHDYVFESPGKHRPTSYDLMSPGPDGVAGTADDLANWQ